jgi:hypothetical protein
MVSGAISKKFDGVKGYHSIFACLFLAALVFRYFASQTVPINSYEAAILLKTTGRISIIPDGFSVLESALIKLTFFVFGESDLGARIWSILIGSLLVFWPLSIREKININSAIGLAFLIAIDPFMVVNSIQIGSNIFSVFSCVYLVSAIMKNKKNEAMLFSILVLISGRGLFFPLILGLLCVVFYVEFVINKIEELNLFSSETRKKRIDPQGLLFIFSVILLFFIILLKLDLSAPISDLIKIFSSFFIESIPISSLFRYPIILISYQPLLILSSITGIVILYKIDRKVVGSLLAWIFMLFIIFLINPYFIYLDLIWISFPISIISAVQIFRNIIKIRGSEKNDILGLIAFSVGMISFCINFFILIYQGKSGYSQSNAFLSLISILIIIISLGILYVYQFSFKKFVFVFINSVLVIFIFIQISVSFRASGLIGLTDKELLWAGNIVERKQLFNQIDILSKTRKESSDSIKIGLIDFLDPSLIWELKEFELKEIKNPEFPNERYDILISDVELMPSSPYEYFGQKFLKNTHPGWVDMPLSNFISVDYWSWNTVRRSEMEKSYYYIYVTTE